MPLADIMVSRVRSAKENGLEKGEGTGRANDFLMPLAQHLSVDSLLFLFPSPQCTTLKTTTPDTTLEEAAKLFDTVRERGDEKAVFEAGKESFSFFFASVGRTFSNDEDELFS